ncbi:MAG: hypothetical protein LQ350_008315 [Teloschistes chrysophthalmus]|nr:MAG: hypothetical protein LQ350_008315 [Niorma chrysophthalma]
MLKPDATAVYVAANQAAGAIEEAIEAEIPLVVAVAEHIPSIDIMRITSILKTQTKSRLVGPNSPGIISAVGRCRIGFQPLPCFQPGVVGIVARSGTLSYEAVASTTRAGLGQSLVIGMGGDILPGTDFVDALTVFEHHKETKGIVLVGEIGGESELKAAEWIKGYRKRTEKPKPIMALVAGSCARPERIMGHAGAWTQSFKTRFPFKFKTLQSAGATMADHPSQFGSRMRQLLGRSPLSHIRPSGDNRPYDTRPVVSSSGHTVQTRSLYTYAKRPRMIIRHLQLSSKRGGHFLSPRTSRQLLEDYKIPQLMSKKTSPAHTVLIKLNIDRSSGRLGADIRGSEAHLRQMFHRTNRDASTFAIWFRRLCHEHGYRPVTSVLGQRQSTVSEKASSFSFDLRSHFTDGPVEEKYHLDDPTGYLLQLIRAFFHAKMFSLYANFRRIDDDATGTSYQLCGAKVGVDALVYERPRATMDEGEGGDGVAEDTLTPAAEAAKHGMVYTRLAGKGTIGTLVNGAGLAMNTVDVLEKLGGSAANFLDTGGKATSDTIKTSFSLILADARVKVVFVNIFGGLTLCDMVAEGIMLAYKTIGIQKPVVVRLRGTNEELGQKMIAESGLPLHAFDDFEEAALKAIELAEAHRVPTAPKSFTPPSKTLESSMSSSDAKTRPLGLGPVTDQGQTRRKLGQDEEVASFSIKKVAPRAEVTFRRTATVKVRHHPVGSVVRSYVSAR